MSISETQTLSPLDDPTLSESDKAFSQFSPEAQAARRIAEEHKRRYEQTHDKGELDAMNAALETYIEETEPKEKIDQVRDHLAAQAIEKNK